MTRTLSRGVLERFVDTVGGAASARVIVLLGLVVGLEAAGNGTVGALAVPLKAGFDISNTELGLLVSVSTGVGVLAALPCGALADRVNRKRLLWITVVLWSASMALSGAGDGYAWLLTCRMAQGLVVAVAGPVVASLVGDFFPASQRGRIYGFVLAGEGICTAVALEVSGLLAPISWRLGFWWLAVVGVGLAVAVTKVLPEPSRGARGHLVAVADSRATNDVVMAEVIAQHVSADPARVLRENPERRSMWWAVRYVLTIRTNVVLIVASAIGYFFFTGLGTFAVALLRGRFQLGQLEATLLLGVIGIGALTGALSSGRIADWMIGRGHVAARMTAAGVAFLAAGMFFLPALLTHSLVVAVVFAFLAASGLGGVNPPLDAGRLDFMHSRLWGRAEAVRTTLRSVATALAPLAFGYVSTRLGGNTHGALNQTFLIMLVTLFVAGLLVLFIARRTYPRDVATALASELATKGEQGAEAT
jgi:MFS family permease